jgi:hypothetical protein
MGGVATGYGLDGRGSFAGRDKFSSQLLDRLWGPHRHLSKGYRISFPRSEPSRA